MDAYQVISQELNIGETILWAGQPSLRRLFTNLDSFFVLLYFFLFGCSFFIYRTVDSALKPSAAAFFSIFFVLVGLYGLFGHFLVKLYKRKNTYYSVTDKRVLIVTASARNVNIVSAYLCDIKDQSLLPGRSGIGDIIFCFEPPVDAAFYDIDNANKVYEIYEDAKSGSRNF